MMLEKPNSNFLTALLEYNDLFNLHANIKQPFGRSYPGFYYSASLYFILNIATVAN